VGGLLRGRRSFALGKDITRSGETTEGDWVVGNQFAFRSGTKGSREADENYPPKTGENHTKMILGVPTAGGSLSRNVAITR